MKRKITAEEMRALAVALAMKHVKGHDHWFEDDPSKKFRRGTSECAEIIARKISEIPLEVNE